VSICMLLFVTGEETTVNTVGNGILALLEQPEQLQLLRDRPDLIDTAIEEMLRFDSPVQSTARIATEDLELGGKQIKAGDMLSVCLAAANRDPARFDRPDRLDIARKDNPHVAFGDGIHYCLGAALARVQAQIAVNTLLREFDHLVVATDQRPWRSHIVLRGLTSLPLNFTVRT
ncbi:MAG: cytochrome P450, partial [Cyanobacteria bacterium J06648_11]